MQTQSAQTSFTGGELSPAIQGRPDLVRYDTGLAKAMNAFVDSKGGISNRHGTMLVGFGKFAERKLVLRRFVVDQLGTSYIVEFGHNYIRIILGDSYLTEDAKTVTAISAANPAVVTSAAHGFVNGDWVILGGMTTPIDLVNFPCIVAGATTNTFQVTDIDGLPVDSSAMEAFAGAGTASKVYELASPFDETAIQTLKFSQDNDVLTITCYTHPVYELRRTAVDEFELVEADFDLDVVKPTGVTATPSSAGAVEFAYVVTAVSGNEESLPSVAAKCNSVNIGTTSGSIAIAWDRVDDAEYYNVYKAQVSPGNAVAVGALYGYVGTTYGLSFKDGNILADFTKTPPRQYNPFSPGRIEKVTPTSGGSGYADTTEVVITDATGTGASVIAIVLGGELIGYIVENAGKNYSAPVFGTTNDGGGTGATVTFTVGDTENIFPSCSANYAQRRMFASTLNRPSTIFGSRTAALEDFSYSNPTIASDSMELTIRSEQRNTIQHLITMQGGLVVLTTGGVWQLTGGSPNSIASATDAQANPQAFNGCSSLPPITINFEILYVQEKGSVIRDLSYNLFSNVYTGKDVTLYSSHLFQDKSLVSWAYADEPHKIVWAVNNKGELRSLTFIKEEKLEGWTPHSTSGFYEWVETIPRDGADVPYFSVKRFLRGKWRRVVEVQVQRKFEYGVEDSWFVDCGLANELTYPAANVTLSGTTGSITATADAAIFSADDVGKILRANGAIGTVTAFTSATSLTVSLSRDVQNFIEFDYSTGAADLTIPEALSGEWSLTEPKTTFAGFWHLEGKQIRLLADGNVFAPQVVTNGRVVFPVPVSKVRGGLGYITELETLDLVVEGKQVEGEKKRVTKVSAQVYQSRGIKYGTPGQEYVEYRSRTAAVPMGTPLPLETTDQVISVFSSYDRAGRVGFRMEYPLPMTLLSLRLVGVVGDK